MKVDIVVSPADDESLEMAHWFAVANADALAAMGHWVVRLYGPEATRENLERVLPGATGLAIFTHGSDPQPNAEFRARGGPLPPPSLSGARSEEGRSQLLDPDNLVCARGCWVHAFACRSAAMIPDALQAGVSVFVGYRVALNAEWRPDPVPLELGRLVRSAATLVSMSVAKGIVNEVDIGRALRGAVDDVIDWLDGVPIDEEPPGLRILIGQMRNHLVFAFNDSFDGG